MKNSDLIRNQIRILTESLIESERAEQIGDSLAERLSGFEEGAIVVAYIRFRSSKTAAWAEKQYCYPFVYQNGYFFGRFTANSLHRGSENANKYTLNQLVEWLTRDNRMVESLYLVAQMEEI